MPSRKSVATALTLFGLIAGAPTLDAAIVDVFEDNGNPTELFAEDGSFLVGIDFENIHPVWIEVTRDEGDGDTLDFGGLFLNDTGIPWTDFHIELEGATFGEVAGGILTGNQFELDNAQVLVDLTADALWLDFIPPEPLGLLLGGLFDDGIDEEEFLSDPFLIDMGGLEPGASFSVHIFPTVPEPGTLALIGAAFLAVVVRRRR